MVHSHHHLHKGHIAGREEASYIPNRTLALERSHALVARSTCTNDTDPGCTKPTVVPTLPIVLAIIIPVVGAAILLFFLHRRNVRKLREEDAKDEYGSLDFGIDASAATKKASKGKGPEMALTQEEKGSNPRQLSLDLDAAHHPYILPAGLHGSRESFHSLSRSTHDTHDPYRPVAFIKDDASIRTLTRNPFHDGDSLHTTSSGSTDRNGLLKNAQMMSQSLPLRGPSLSLKAKDQAHIKFPEPIAVPLSPLRPREPEEALPPPPPPSGSPLESRPSDSNATKSSQAKLGEFLPPVQERHDHEPTAQGSRIKSQEVTVRNQVNTASFISASSYGDGFQVTPPSPEASGHATTAQGPLAPQPQRPISGVQSTGLGIDNLDDSNHRLSISLRPLPPDDPSDNAEQRANRIRSFYKEYFDDSKPEPAGGHVYYDYAEDYGSEYLDGTIFDPHTGNFVIAHAQAPRAPYAQPVTRRAMTPPPRAPPRFRSNTSMSQTSSGHYPPRGMSSMSGRATALKKTLPPPSALASLPTPAKLTEDAMVFNAADFAPPVTFRDRQNGMRPDSPLGTPRPYSPAVRPHTPLASAFDDLAVMPSPHLLRKSGTFTALDFAPPPRFRDPGSNASDAGSIRSNRSGMSAAGRLAVRNGAYRVSRIPKEVVGTRDDWMVSLRPKMNLTQAA